MPRRVFRCAARARGGFLVFAKKQENTEEIKAMPFQKGQSGNPAGRPRGIVNRATALAQDLLSEHAEWIARKVIELAEEGDMAAIRVCMERLVPPIKHQPIAVELPPIEKPADSVEAVASIAAAVAAGDLTAAEAAELAKVVDVYVRALDSKGFNERLSALEQEINGTRAGACRRPRRHERLRLPMPPPDNWLMKLTKRGARQPRTHLLCVDARDTPRRYRSQAQPLDRRGSGACRRHVRARALEKAGRNLRSCSPRAPHGKTTAV